MCSWRCGNVRMVFMDEHVSWRTHFAKLLNWRSYRIRWSCGILQTREHHQIHISSRWDHVLEQCWRNAEVVTSTSRWRFKYNTVIEGLFIVIEVELGVPWNQYWGANDCRFGVRILKNGQSHSLDGRMGVYVQPTDASSLESSSWTPWRWFLMGYFDHSSR